MKRTIFFYCLVLIFAICTGCTKEINLHLNDIPRHIVIEGNVYNTPGPYYFRVTWSNSALLYPAYAAGRDKSDPVLGALLILSDDLGNTDTLRPSPDSLMYYGRFYRNRSSPYDSVLIIEQNYFSGRFGFYESSNIRGIMGHSYHLRVVYDNKEYNADAYMPPVTTIDSVQFRTRYTEKGDPYVTPVIFFAEPQNQTNYYWTFIVDDINDNEANVHFLDQGSPYDLPYSIFNDKFLEPYVNGLYSDRTYAKNAVPGGFYNSYGFVCLGSLTEEHYNFLKTLTDQIQDDGGTYKPTPTSPKSNISNGALGYFSASALSRYFVFGPDFP